MADEIALVEYDARWPIYFEEEAEWLRNVLPYDLPLAIDHIGSTAVPGLEAKPIVDIVIAVQSVDAARESTKLLEGLGYEARPVDPGKDRLHFVKQADGARSHHVHIVRIGDSAHGDYLLFRDHLRTSLEDAAAYAALKRELAARFSSDRAAYTEGKTAFVQGVLVKARERAARIAAQWDDDD